MDEEDIFPVLCPIKTYSKPFKKATNATSQYNNVENTSEPAGKINDRGVPLSTKVAVEYLLNGKLKTNVCRYCLKVTVALSELDQIMQIAGTGVMYKVTIREIIACFYPFKARQDENFPEKICQKCIDRALNAYLFTQQCEQAERALHNYFEDINEKFNKLDPIDRPKKRGRQKLNPNINKLYVEHYNVMDYAEPLRNIINIHTESLSKEPDWNEFECKKCWQVLPDLESLLNHEQIHPKYMWYHCRLCGKSFVKHNQLKKHFNQVHIRRTEVKREADKIFKCKECGNVTENHLQHLQHVEKHKFKSVMKHLIEKKTDRLCLVCLKKTTDLVELDKMVCIHGSCPELVGDTPLYTVLASTLPGKSYKYQELHVPYKADIMTITLRKRKYKEIQNVLPGVEFKLSLPKIITNDKFKTHDFYYYVFCEPDTEYCIINPEDCYISTQDNKSPRVFEIADERTMDIDDKMMTNDNQGVSVFGGNIKNPAIVVENCNPEIGMLTNDNEPTNIIKRSNLNIDIQDSDLNLQIKRIKVPGKHSGAEIKMGGKQVLLTGNSNVKDNSLHVENVKMDVVDNCVTENTSFKEAKTTTKPENTIHTKDLIAQNSEIGSKSSMFLFSDPIASGLDFNINLHNVKLDTIKVSMFRFSSPDHVGKTFDQDMYTITPIEVTDIPGHHVAPVKLNYDLSWIFTKVKDKYNSVNDNVVTDNVTNAMPQIKEERCTFCWLFKHSDKCEYCKKSIVPKICRQEKEESIKIMDDVKQNIVKDTVYDNINNNKVEKPIDTARFIGEKPTKVERYDNVTKLQKTWQCNVCLTNNTKDRSTCQCCESKKYIENINCKVTFGNNKTFFDTTNEQENKNGSEIEKEGDIFNKKSVPFIVVDEDSMMDTKTGSMPENIELAIDSIRDTNSTHSMDIEMDSVNCPIEAVNNDMDVEDEAFIPNTTQKFDPTPTKQLSANVVTYVGTNIQFNIGSNLKQNEKGARKIKKAVRHLPKAIHK